MNTKVELFVLLALFIGVAYSDGGQSQCASYDEYQKLEQLQKHNTCMDVARVFGLLYGIYGHSEKCAIHIINLLADHYGPHRSPSPKHCSCHGVNILQEYHTGFGDGMINHRRSCLRSNPAYKDMYGQFFNYDKFKVHRMACRTHQSVWSALRGIDPSNNGADRSPCIKDIIYHISYAFENHHDNCTCRLNHVSPQAKTSASTLPSTTTLPSTEPSTTTLPSSTTLSSAEPSATTVTSTTTLPSTATQQTTPILKYVCNKLQVVEDIAKSNKATNPDSSACNPNAGGSDDAYVLSTCNMTSPVLWKKGVNVLADCQSSSHLIPTYTPISTFTGDSYIPLGAQSGIFLGCYNNGIKMAIQKCNGLPEIVHIENGDFVNDPNSYYVIA